MIPLSVPNISGNELKYVTECLETGWISSSGEFVNKFEDSIKNFTGSKYAIACMNGTVALHISLLLSGVNKDNIVLAPNLTFVATLNSISYTGAQLILFDINEFTWQIDVDLVLSWLKNNTITKIENGKKISRHIDSGKKISAIVPVHVLGGLCEMKKLIKISKEYGITIVEDSTEALGSYLKKKHAGTYGKFGTFSFNGNKIISTGGGGMIVTDDEILAKRARHLTTTAKTDSLKYFHDEIGYNYRLVNILAAVGFAQMENFNKILKRKKEITRNYKSELKNIGDIIFQENISDSNPNCWLFTFRTKKMNQLMEHLEKNKIQSRPFWTPMNKLPMYKNLEYVEKKNVSNNLYKENLSIPSSSNLTEFDQQKVIQSIKNFFI